MDVNFEFFSIEPTTIIGTLINTLLLLLVVKKFLFEPVNKILDERKAEVSKTYEEADAALANARSLEEEYTQKMSAAKEESAELIRNATKRAQDRSDEIIAAAKSEAQGMMERAGQDIERERTKAISGVRDEISDIAVSIAEKVIGRNVSSDSDQDRLIDEFISSIE
ncbi:MAG: F0F1 ATP synthase subunit B [Oscillospiraceae bacterium]|nr:F0F1 ATP synthase subunit B [Oscillospiraceae bacterium]